MDAMMQCCKAKSENLAHILGYQTGAVTTSHHTCIHRVWHHLGFCGIPMLQSPTSVKPEAWWKKVKLPDYPFDRRQKGGNKWTIFLGYVRVGHRNMENEKYSQDSLWFT